MVQIWDGLTPQTRETDAHTFQFLLFIQNSAKSQPMTPPHEAQESGPVHLTVGVTQLFLPTLQTPWLSSMLSRSPFRGGHSHPTFLLLWEPPKRRGKGWGRERPAVNGDNKIWLSGFTNKVEELLIARRGTERWERSEGQRWMRSVLQFSDLMVTQGKHPPP